jgi:hypothetical protein
MENTVRTSHGVAIAPVAEPITFRAKSRVIAPAAAPSSRTVARTRSGNDAPIMRVGGKRAAMWVAAVAKSPATYGANRS